MTYALIASNIAWAAFAAFLVVKGLNATTALLDKARSREDELLNRIQAPELAVAQSLPDQDPSMYISAFDDDTLAREEAERFKIKAE